ncbi:hypothetical protein BGZ99_006100, partial [Dissophora globulifera]
MSSSTQDLIAHTLTASGSLDSSASLVSPATVPESWESLDTSMRLTLKAEPMSPFGGPSLGLNSVSPLQMSHVDTLAEAPRPPLIQQHQQPQPQLEPMPMQIPLSLSFQNQMQQVQAHVPSSLQLQASSSSSSLSSSSSSSPSMALQAAGTGTATGATPTSTASFSKPFMYTSQLPPMPPSLVIPQVHQSQASSLPSLPSSRNVQSTPLNHHYNSQQQQPNHHHQYGLAHLSELMTGGLVVSKTYSNRPAATHALLHCHASPSEPFMGMQQQQQLQPGSSHSDHDPFAYDQSTGGSLYSSSLDHQQQFQLHHRHGGSDAFLMSRGPSSSSSTCSTSSSATFPYDSHHHAFGSKSNSISSSFGSNNSGALSGMSTLMTGSSAVLATAGAGAGT